jgi:hypothetical protein
MSDYSFRLETTAGRLYAFVVAEDGAAAEIRLKAWILHNLRAPVGILILKEIIPLKRLPTQLAVHDPRVLSLWGEGEGPPSICKDWYALGRGSAWESFYQDTFWRPTRNS